MIGLQSPPATNPEHSVDDEPRRRVAVDGAAPSVLADVYREDVNISIRRRELADDVVDVVRALTSSNPTLKTAMTLSPENALVGISESLGTGQDCPLAQDVTHLVEMFCDLFGLRRAGLRLGVLNSAMCPKFHVDRVPCRLVTTYLGDGTEWLPHDVVDRSKLGMGAAGKPDHESGIYSSADDIQQLSQGEIALLKGELWEGNENGGLVHRSPAVADGELRLLVTLDVSD